jgi:hypothetical protein
MSAMSNLAIDVEILVEQGKSVEFIASKLFLPLNFAKRMVASYKNHKDDIKNSLPSTSLKLI